MTEENKHDVDGLLRKNAELLAEVKSLKANLAEIETERDAALADSEAANATVRQIAVETPIEDEFGQAFVAPWRVVRPLLDEHFDFAISDQGAISIKSKDGEELSLETMRAELSAIPDLAAMVKPARGGGAKSASQGGVHNGEAVKQKKVASPFSLR